jgi:adenylate cyclase class IV
MKYLVCSLLCGSLLLANDSQKSLEIEIKFKASQEDVLRLKRSLPLPCKEVEMVELYVFGHALQPVYEGNYKKMERYVRLRSTPKGSFITFKERSSGEVIEYECCLNDIVTMDSILQALGYGTVEADRVVLRKKRAVYTASFENYVIEVVFDAFEQPEHLRALGEFVEVELKSPTLSYHEGIAVLESFLMMHGIEKIEVYVPYIELALNPSNLRYTSRVLKRVS